MKKAYTLKIYEESGSALDLVIPEGFTEIGVLTFCKVREKLKSVVFPSTLTTLPAKLFINCTKLESVDLGKCKADVLPDSFFNYCPNLKQVILPSGIVSIGEDAFIYCHSLKEISLPEGVKKIGETAFRHCRSLESISLPKGIKKLSADLFGSCINLRKVTLPDNLTVIEEAAFAYCSALVDIVIPDTVSSINERAFRGCESLQNIAIPAHITEISDQTFDDCSSLQDVSIPEGVVRIGEEAFMGCSSLKSVSIPKSVVKIGSRAFKDCKSLKGVIIPERVTEVGDWAFDGCDSLKSIVIPDSVTRMGKKVLGGCHLNNFDTESANFKVSKGVLIDKRNSEIISAAFVGQIDMAIPAGITAIGEGAFHECELKSLSLPESVSVIKHGAFEDIKSLRHVTIPRGLTAVQAAAFSYCSSLESVTIENPNTKFDDGSFNRCANLTTVNLPKGLSWTRLKKAFTDTPWGKISPRGAIMAKKAAEEAEAKKALKIKEDKVKQMTAMGSAFVIKQMFETEFKTQTVVKPYNNNERYEINFELVQGMELRLRMPIVLKLEKLQGYTAKLIKKLSMLKSVFDENFVGPYSEDNRIAIAVSGFDETGEAIARISMNQEHLCTKAGNLINYECVQMKFNLFISLADQFAEAVKNVDSIADIKGEYRLELGGKRYIITLVKAVTAAPQVNLPSFVGELHASSFKGCTKLAEISINRATKIHGWPFSGCTALKEIHLY